MSKITFYIGEESYTFNAAIEIKLDGETKPNNLRVENHFIRRNKQIY